MLNAHALQEFFLEAIQKALHGDGLISHVCTGGLIEEQDACLRAGDPLQQCCQYVSSDLRENYFYS